ncbi:hypothetical protein [Flavobacterium sp. WV_118_3]|uniref:hypothetical protein n=1 Tax=Flavobacterium sp. WV_118_3 TaxID=3151764 RepID=UPI00321B6A85
MNYLLLLFSLFSYTIQEQQNPLVNTKWEYKFAENCISYLTFKADGTYEDYSYERYLTYSGKCEIIKDTITLFEIGFESEVPDVNEENNYKTGIICKNKLIYKGSFLQYVSCENYDPENKKWSGDIVFPSNKIFYIKVAQ